MRTGYAYLLLALTSTLIPSVRAAFTLNTTYIGQDFFDAWKWETFDDPTHGRVNYVDNDTALYNNLSYVSDSKFIMRADDSSYVPSASRGRNSVRISSYAAFDESLIVLDLQHMPEGCSTWPAFWTLSQQGPWPHGGEIDIIEGVNLQQQNLASLHTTPGCTMPASRWETGSPGSLECNAWVNSNQGCGVAFSDDPFSYGAQFNAQGGGYYAVQRTQKEGVKMWFWPRSSNNVPPGITGTATLGLLRPPPLSPDSWGKPSAFFPVGDMCDYTSHFDPHIMVFDLTFCGDWAGNVWSTSGCGPQSCTDFVNNNPDAFSNAYWEVNSLHVYTHIPDYQ